VARPTVRIGGSLKLQSKHELVGRKTILLRSLVESTHDLCDGSHVIVVEGNLLEEAVKCHV
jgi:hypothetical protein